MANFNWGHGITIFFILFVGTLVTVLVASRSVDHSLVVDDYYAMDLSYQQRYDAIKNTNANESISIIKDKKNNQLIVTIKSEEKATGEIILYRPSDKSKDYTIPISTNITEIPLNDLTQGKWRVKTTWTIGEKPFYYEQELFI